MPCKDLAMGVDLLVAAYRKRTIVILYAAKDYTSMVNSINLDAQHLHGQL